MERGLCPNAAAISREKQSVQEGTLPCLALPFPGLLLPLNITLARGSPGEHPQPQEWPWGGPGCSSSWEEEITLPVLPSPAAAVGGRGLLCGSLGAVLQPRH